MNKSGFYLSPRKFVQNKVHPYMREDRRWITDYIYHFTNVTNISSILESGMLYARANPKCCAENENAEVSIIEGTNEYVTEYVRFYFRPKTPTQYRNEGIKSEDEMGLYMAHCPIPVFLLFDFDKLFMRPDCFFSYESLASRYSVNLYQGYNSLQHAPLLDIYHEGAFPPEDRERIVKRRHAEVLVKNQCDLSALKKIYCRTEAERETLLNLLTPGIKSKYKSIISVCAKPRDLFHFERFMIKDVSLNVMNDLEVEYLNAKGQEYATKILWKTVTGKNICSYEGMKKYNYARESWDSSKYTRLHEYFKVEIHLDDNLVYAGLFEQLIIKD